MSRPIRSLSLPRTAATVTATFGLLGLLTFGLARSTRSDKVQPEDRNEILATIVAAHPRPGDVLFRRGRSILSSAVLAADAEGRFSHVGIIVTLPDGLGVVHTVPGHADAGGGARGDPISEFLDPDLASAAALYRLIGDDRERSQLVQRAARDFATRAVPFDGDFDLEHQDRLYCTELVWAAFLRAGLDLTQGHFDSLDVPFAKGPHLLPSRLETSPHLRLITSTRP